MAMNPLSPSMATLGQGSPVEGVNTRPYPTLGPAQGGVGPGAEGAPMPEEEKPDNIANMAKLLMLFGIQPGDPKAAGVAMGFGIQGMKRIADQGLSRGITDEQGPQGPAPQPAMPPGMSATPMPPSGGF
jgi:hypothetical protein